MDMEDDGEKTKSLLDLPDKAWQLIGENFTVNPDEEWLNLCNASPQLEKVVTKALRRSKLSLIGDKVFSILVEHSYLNREDLLQCCRASEELGGFVASSWHFLLISENCSFKGAFKTVYFRSPSNIKSFMADVDVCNMKRQGIWELFLGKRFVLLCLPPSSESKHEFQQEFWKTAQIFLERYGKYIVHITFDRPHPTDEVETRARHSAMRLEYLPRVQELIEKADNGLDKFPSSNKLILDMDEFTRKKSYCFINGYTPFPGVMDLLVLASNRIRMWRSMAINVNDECFDITTLDNLKEFDLRGVMYTRFFQRFEVKGPPIGILHVEKLRINSSFPLNPDFPRFLSLFHDLNEVWLTIYGERGAQLPEHVPDLEENYLSPKVETLRLCHNPAYYPLDRFSKLFPKLKHLILEVEPETREFKQSVKNWAEDGSLDKDEVDVLKLYNVDPGSVAQSNIWTVFSHLCVFSIETQTLTPKCSNKPKHGTPYYTKTERYAKQLNGTIQFEERIRKTREIY